MDQVEAKAALKAWDAIAWFEQFLSEHQEFAQAEFVAAAQLSRFTPEPAHGHVPGIRPGDWVATWPEAVLLGLHINPFEALGISSGRLYSVLLDVEDESGQEQGTAAAIKGGSNWEECEASSSSSTDGAAAFWLNGSAGTTNQEPVESVLWRKRFVLRELKKKKGAKLAEVSAAVERLEAMLSRGNNRILSDAKQQQQQQQQQQQAPKEAAAGTTSGAGPSSGTGGLDSSQPQGSTGAAGTAMGAAVRVVRRVWVPEAGAVCPTPSAGHKRGRSGRGGGDGSGSEDDMPLKKWKDGVGRGTPAGGKGKGKGAKEQLHFVPGWLYQGLFTVTESQDVNVSNPQGSDGAADEEEEEKEDGVTLPSKQLQRVRRWKLVGVPWEHLSHSEVHKLCAGTKPGAPCVPLASAVALKQQLEIKAAQVRAARKAAAVVGKVTPSKEAQGPGSARKVLKGRQLASPWVPVGPQGQLGPGTVAVGQQVVGAEGRKGEKEKGGRAAGAAGAAAGAVSGLVPTAVPGAQGKVQQKEAEQKAPSQPKADGQVQGSPAAAGPTAVAAGPVAGSAEAPPADDTAFEAPGPIPEFLRDPFEGDEQPDATMEDATMPMGDVTMEDLLLDVAKAAVVPSPGAAAPAAAAQHGSGAGAAGAGTGASEPPAVAAAAAAAVRASAAAAPAPAREGVAAGAGAGAQQGPGPVPGQVVAQSHMVQVTPPHEGPSTLSAAPPAQTPVLPVTAANTAGRSTTGVPVLACALRVEGASTGTQASAVSEAKTVGQGAGGVSDGDGPGLEGRGAGVGLEGLSGLSFPKLKKRGLADAGSKQVGSSTGAAADRATAAAAVESPRQVSTALGAGVGAAVVSHASAGVAGAAGAAVPHEGMAVPQQSAEQVPTDLQPPAPAAKAIPEAVTNAVREAVQPPPQAVQPPPQAGPVQLHIHEARPAVQPQDQAVQGAVQPHSQEVQEQPPAEVPEIQAWRASITARPGLLCADLSQGTEPFPVPVFSSSLPGPQQDTNQPSVSQQAGGQQPAYAEVLKRLGLGRAHNSWQYRAAEYEWAPGALELVAPVLHVEEQKMAAMVCPVSDPGAADERSRPATGADERSRSASGAQDQAEAAGTGSSTAAGTSTTGGFGSAQAAGATPYSSGQHGPSVTDGAATTHHLHTQPCQPQSQPSTPAQWAHWWWEQREPLQVCGARYHQATAIKPKLRKGLPIVPGPLGGPVMRHPLPGLHECSGGCMHMHDAQEPCLRVGRQLAVPLEVHEVQEAVTGEGQAMAGVAGGKPRWAVKAGVCLEPGTYVCCVLGELKTSAGCGRAFGGTRGVLPLAHLNWLWRATLQAVVNGMQATCQQPWLQVPLHLIPPLPTRPPLGCVSHKAHGPPLVDTNQHHNASNQQQPGSSQQRTTSSNSQGQQQASGSVTAQIGTGSGAAPGTSETRQGLSQPQMSQLSQQRAGMPFLLPVGAGPQLCDNSTSQPAATAVASGSPLSFPTPSLSQLRGTWDAASPLSTPQDLMGKGFSAATLLQQPADWSNPLLVVDGCGRMGNLSALIRHEKVDPNLCAQVVYAGRCRSAVLYYAALFTNKRVEAGDELTLNWDVL